MYIVALYIYNIIQKVKMKEQFHCVFVKPSIIKHFKLITHLLNKIDNYRHPMIKETKKHLKYRLV